MGPVSQDGADRAPAGRAAYTVVLAWELWNPGIRLSYTEGVVLTLVRRMTCLGCLLTTAAIPLGGQQGSATPPVVTPPFERYIDLLRQQAGIPGLSAVIVKDSQITW